MTKKERKEGVPAVSCDGFVLLDISLILDVLCFVPAYGAPSQHAYADDQPVFPPMPRKHVEDQYSD